MLSKKAKANTVVAIKALAHKSVKSIGHEAAPTFFWGGKTARTQAVHR